MKIRTIQVVDLTELAKEGFLTANQFTYIVKDYDDNGAYASFASIIQFLSNCTSLPNKDRQEDSLSHST